MTSSKSNNSRIWLIIGVTALLLAIFIPFFANNAQLRLLTDFLKFAAMASAWNLIGGFTGYPSFGQVVFYGIGAYGTGYALTTLGWPFFPALFLGAAIAGLFALILGIPVLRLKGHYFAIATLGAAEAVREIVRNLDVVNANEGLVLPPVYDPQFFYFIMLALVALTTLGIWVITKTRFGYGLLAIREDEEAADVLGINTRLYKTAAFVISGVIVGLVGGVHMYHSGYMEPVLGFNVLITVKMIVMAVIGGAGSVAGPLIGSGLIFFSSEYLATLSETLRNLPVIFFGILLVVASLFLPRGLWDIISGRQKLSWKMLLQNIRSHRV